MTLAQHTPIALSSIAGGNARLQRCRAQLECGRLCSCARNRTMADDLNVFSCLRASPNTLTCVQAATGQSIIRHRRRTAAASRVLIYLCVCVCVFVYTDTQAHTFGIALLLFRTDGTGVRRYRNSHLCVPACVRALLRTNAHSLSKLDNSIRCSAHHFAANALVLTRLDSATLAAVLALHLLLLSPHWSPPPRRGHK